MMIGDMIAKARKEKGMSKTELARLTDINIGHLTHIEKGERKESRAGVTRSLFGRQMRFNLKEGLPMLTTKKVFTKGIIHELLWFISGETNIKYLVDNGVHIWDDDAYRFYLEKAKYMDEKLTKEEFLDAVVNQKVFWLKTEIEGHLVPYQAGNLGPVYGEQWNNFGGHNQIQEVIDTLKKKPDDRRMIVSAWNPEEIPYMALPPCHYCFQFYTKKMNYQERLDYYHERHNFWYSYRTNDGCQKYSYKKIELYVSYEKHRRNLRFAV